jgi:mono/diheme cytochrome c family protein
MTAVQFPQTPFTPQSVRSAVQRFFSAALQVRPGRPLVLGSVLFLLMVLLGLAVQADPGETPKQSPPPAPAAQKAAQIAGRKVFQAYCHKCHEADGTGSSVRDVFPEIPNFTEGAWQARRTDPQLLVSILDGKGKSMPSFRGKISKEGADQVISYVRSFGPKRRPTKDAAPTDFESRFRELEKQFDELTKQLRELSRARPKSHERTESSKGAILH